VRVIVVASGVGGVGVGVGVVGGASGRR
jgi:hypothetical protein